MGRWQGLALAAALFVGGCASLDVPLNQPLRRTAGNTEYRLLDLGRSGGNDLALVALSGGGKRSAAFAFGA